MLEAHILTSISPATKQLILIGDQMQLRPKVDTFELKFMSGKGLNLDMSLIERLVKGGFPYAVLSTQHRMRPEISALIRGTYPKASAAAATRKRMKSRWEE